MTAALAAAGKFGDGRESGSRHFYLSGGCFSGCKHGAGYRQKQPVSMQQRLKQSPGAAGAGIIPPELFAQFLVAVNDPFAALDLGFRRESAAAFARYLKTAPVR